MYLSVSLKPHTKVTKLTDTSIYDNKNKKFSKGPSQLIPHVLW